MNTTNLSTFITVMQTGSISGAAEKLFITQPAVSKRIKSLEDEFGTALFDTIGRGIIPTTSAHELLPYAKKWLEDYESCKANLLYSKEVATGRLVIGTSHHIGLHHLPPVLKQFIQAYPSVQLEVQFMDSETAHKAVLEGDVALAFLTLPPTFDRRLAYHTLWSDPLHFVTGVLSPLAQQSSISLLQLARHPAILPAANTYTSQITLGLGWSVLPETLINQDLVKIDLNENIELQRHLGLVINPNLTRSSGTDALLDMLGIKDVHDKESVS